MIFLTKAKDILTDHDYKLINILDLKRSRDNIQKRIKIYRHQFQYSDDPDFREARKRQIQAMRAVSKDLRKIINSQVEAPKYEWIITK